MKGYFIGLLGLSDDRYRTVKRRTGNCAALFHKRNEGTMILPPVGCAGGGGPEGAHQHHVLIPEKMRRLKPGDRVLVAWVQSEAVVVDIICPAEDLKK